MSVSLYLQITNNPVLNNIKKQFLTDKDLHCSQMWPLLFLSYHWVKDKVGTANRKDYLLRLGNKKGKLYLIKTNKSNHIKIGYTSIKNLKSRLIAHKTSNPDITNIIIHNASPLYEAFLHFKCTNIILHHLLDKPVPDKNLIEQIEAYKKGEWYQIGEIEELDKFLKRVQKNPDFTYKEYEEWKKYIHNPIKNIDFIIKRQPINKTNKIKKAA